MADAILVSNLSLEYHVLQRKGILSMRKKAVVRALDSVSFSIKRGEIVAVLGNNGAGKSTLLAAVSGKIRPSEGSVETHGMVFTLQGSNPGLINDLSARENIRMLASSYGIEESDVPSLESEIEDFCDLGDAFDRKLSTLSSGQNGRVGFGFITSLNPDILLMDETLGVGDKNFRKKAEEKSKAFMERGETILLSTHSLNLAKNMCSRGLVLEKGILAFDGPVEEAIDYYLGR